MEIYESHFIKNKRCELTEYFIIYSMYIGKSIANDKKTISNFLEPLFRLNEMAEVGRLAYRILFKAFENRSTPFVSFFPSLVLFLHISFRTKHEK